MGRALNHAVKRLAWLTSWALVAAACTPPEEPMAPEEIDDYDEEVVDGNADTADSATHPAPADPRAPGFTRYPPDGLRSPITPSVAERMYQIAGRRDRDDMVFMKVGASGTVSRNLLYCLAGESQPQYRIDLGGRTSLQTTLDWFRGGDAAGATPFDRITIAAQVGKTAKWVQTGSPSPLSRETTALDPRFAFVNYGTNDMGMASTFAGALPLFAEQMYKLLDKLEEGGIVPIVTGLNPRGDSAEAARWAPTFDAVTRGLAESRQLPYISLYNAVYPLAAHGLGSDGLHGNAASEDGRAQPCVFSAAGLAYNYNLRNLLSLEALDAARRIVVDRQTPAESAPLPLVAGRGTRAEPFVIDRLPFTHHFDTRGAASEVARWSCSSSNEGGPEIYYRLTLPAATGVRAVVIDRGTTDVDVHFVSPDGVCADRGDTVVDKRLPAGQHQVVVDTFVSAGTPRAGRYLLVVLACEAGDSSCQ